MGSVADSGMGTGEGYPSRPFLRSRVRHRHMRRCARLSTRGYGSRCSIDSSAPSEADPALAERIPPGQYKTDKFPVLHYGSVPHTDLATWDFRVWGEVDSPFTLTWDQFKALPRKTVHTDIHCVTRWTKLDTDWEGVAIQTILEMAGVRPNATHVVSHAEQGYTANVPLSVLDDDDVLLADTFGGAPLELEHGYPLRLLDPEAVLLEEQQVGPRPRVPRPRPARLLGALRLQQRRGPLEGGALQRVAARRRR